MNRLWITFSFAEKETDSYRVSLKISKVEELRLYLREQLSWPNSSLPLKMRVLTILPSCLVSIRTTLLLPWRLFWCPGDLSFSRSQFLTGSSLYRQLFVKLRMTLSQWWQWSDEHWSSSGSWALGKGVRERGPSSFPWFIPIVPSFPSSFPLFHMAVYCPSGWNG